MEANTIISSTSGSRVANVSLPSAVLAHLASRMRLGGLFLVVLRPDGSIGFHDQEAGLFFQRYVFPALEFPDLAQQPICKRAMSLTSEAEVGIWQTPPGVVVAAAPLIERRQHVATILLAGKSTSFNLGEDLQRVCSRLAIDVTWLSQQADPLPACGDDAIQRQLRLVLSMVRDQVRIYGMQQEIDSLSSQLANSYEELSLIYQISGGMKINRRPADFFKQACLDVLEVMQVAGMGVALNDSLMHQLPVLYGSLSLPPGEVHRLASQLLSIVGQRKKALLINDLSADPGLAWMGQYARRLIAVPLQRQDQVLGCLFGIDKIAGDFDSVDSKLLNSIANESAIYLENARLFEDVHGLMMGLLHSLTSAVDAKDAYTFGHSERVALFSRHLAKQAKVPDADVERIYMAGLLHDVGKIGVPESVLQKAGKLTNEEYDMMKKHPRIGARILRDIKQIEDIIPGVLYHHERWDGRGYPEGLKGTEIPLMGRIICLADCFDAMTSNRTYRRALPIQTALDEIRNSRGTQFDPDLADEFLAIGGDRLQELIRNQQEQAVKMMDLQESLRGAENAPDAS